MKILPQKAFSMIELMVVIVIIGILGTIAVFHYKSSMESALDNEVKSNLKLIAAAEKLYRLEAGQYVAAAGESEINTVLRLILPANNATKKWEYSVTTAASNTTFDATGTRYNVPSSRTFHMNNTDEEPHSP